MQGISDSSLCFSFFIVLYFGQLAFSFFRILFVGSKLPWFCCHVSLFSTKCKTRLLRLNIRQWNFHQVARSLPFAPPTPYMRYTVYAWSRIHMAPYMHGAIYVALYTHGAVYVAPYTHGAVYVALYMHGAIYAWHHICMVPYTFVGKFRGTHHLCWAKACSPHSQLTPLTPNRR